MVPISFAKTRIAHSFSIATSVPAGGLSNLAGYASAAARRLRYSRCAWARPQAREQ